MTKARKTKAQPWWQNKVFWGISISILLGLLSMVIEGAETDLKLAALLTLVGLTLTLAIELRFRVDESAAATENMANSQQEFDRHLARFVDYVSAPGSCRDFFAEISDDWRQIETRSSVFLGWLRQDAEREFRVRLHELAAGHGTVDKRSRHNFRSHPLLDFARIRSVDVKLTNFWSSARGRHYLKSQRTAIAAGNLEVSRVFLLSRAEVDNATEVIRGNVQAGIQVSIVIREDIAADPDLPDIEDMSLVTDQSGVTGVLMPGAPGDPDIFTAEERQVAHAEDILDFLSPYARTVDDVYADGQNQPRS